MKVYRWKVYTKDGAPTSGPCELINGSRNMVKRIRSKQAKWPEFLGLSKVKLYITAETIGL